MSALLSTARLSQAYAIYYVEPLLTQLQKYSASNNIIRVFTYKKQGVTIIEAVKQRTSIISEQDIVGKILQAYIDKNTNEVQVRYDRLIYFEAQKNSLLQVIRDSFQLRFDDFKANYPRVQISFKQSLSLYNVDCYIANSKVGKNDYKPYFIRLIADDLLYIDKDLDQSQQAIIIDKAAIVVIQAHFFSS